MKIANFSYPCLIRRPHSLCFLWNFAVKFTMRKLRVMGLSYSEDRVIIAWVVLTQCQRVTDRRTEGTAGFTIVDYIYYSTLTQWLTQQEICNNVRPGEKGNAVTCVWAPMHFLSTLISLMLVYLSSQISDIFAIDGTGSGVYRRVCYYTNWSQQRSSIGKFQTQDIPLHLCTHLIYAFTSMTGNTLDDESQPGMYVTFK